MHVIDQKGLVSGSLFAILGLAVAVGGLRYDLGTPEEMGPGYFPTLVGALLTLVGLVIAISSLRPGAQRTELGTWSIKGLAIIIVSVVVFALLIEPMGLLFAVPAIVGISSLAHPNFTWRAMALSIAVLLPASWLIFVVLLGLRYPLAPAVFFN